jgi:hypothetical protein
MQSAHVFIVHIKESGDIRIVFDWLEMFEKIK